MNHRISANSSTSLCHSRRYRFEEKVANIGQGRHNFETNLGVITFSKSLFYFGNRVAASIFESSVVPLRKSYAT